MNAVNWPVYLKLSGMFFLEFAVWGAWMPVLAARLLGTLKMSGKQTGWIYATLPLASLVAFPLGGQLADRCVDAQWILIVSHVVGAVLLYLAARTEKFANLFVTMLMYSTFFAATLPLVNAIVFRHVSEAGVDAGKVFLWAPVAWALVGYFLTGLRQAGITKSDGADALKLAALCSVAMAAACALLPASPPAAHAEAHGAPFLQVVALLKDPSLLAVTIISVLVGIAMQFYFQGSAQFMQDIGISGKNVSAFMGMAQAVQAVATLFLMDRLCRLIGEPMTMAVGAGCWLLLFGVYVLLEKPALIIVSQGLHGLAYTLFIFVSWNFFNAAAAPAIKSSAQSLIYLATNGVGLFLGTQLAGVVMDKCCAGGKFQWRKIFAVPLFLMVISVVVLAAAVHEPKPAAAQKPAAEKPVDQTPRLQKAAK